ncbi:MAG: histidine--tRNA ligase [Lentisphaeria bacterium]|jgi:histidyl-tRNA synthetase|nr:histidine--tRNA ligase [Lentisphaeria bacterium]
MASSSEPLPGTSDLWDAEIGDWLVIEEAARRVFSAYGYGELRTPVFERTEVFVRSLGDETEVVQKEMYTFADRGGRSLTLRPEGTAGVIRAVANSGLGQGDEKRVFYMGPMFRGERPAAGRRRQFHQVGVEAVGPRDPVLDAECIAMFVQFLDEIGVSGARVQLNTRGLGEDRARVAAALREFFAPRIGEMCEDCQRRLDTNVLRMLDCKAEGCRDIVAGAPNMIDLVGDESREFFARVCRCLDQLGVNYELAPRLVRGLDYYIHTVFEVTHSGLGAQDALAGGGRYSIVPPGATKPVDGVGFAAGMERLLMARQSLGVAVPPRAEADVYVVSLGEASVAPGLVLARDLRQAGLGLRVRTETAGRSMKAQMRTANRLGARLVLIQGESELAAGEVVCKNMVSSEQVTVARAAVVAWLRENA